MKTTVYQFGKKPGKKISMASRLLDKPDRASEEVITPVQGQMPDSIQEWRVAKALDYYKLEYIFQYEVFGGRFTGGQLIDFLVFTKPLPTPIYVQGDYWHRGEKAQQDQLKQAKIKGLFNGQINEAVEIWEHEIPTLADAKRVVKERIR